MLGNEAPRGPHFFEHYPSTSQAFMNIPIRVLAIRAVASFSIAICVLTTFHFAEILPKMSDATETAGTGSQLTLLFFGWVIFSPLVETAFLAILYKTASNYLCLKSSAVLAAVILSALHGFIWWAWPFVVVIPLLIFTIPFMQEKKSTWAALLPSALTHAFHNLYGFVCLSVVYRNL